MKTNIKSHNVTEYLLVKISTAIKQGRKSRPQPHEHVHCKSLSFKHLVEQEEEEAINMKQEREVFFEINKDRKNKSCSSRDRESSSPAAAAEGEGGKKSKSSSPFTIPPPSSFSKFISKKTSKLSFSKWSINHDKMMMKTIVNAGACVYVVGEGDIEDPAVWRRRRKKAAAESSSDHDGDDEKEGYELCRKRILMGERCKPLNISGKLQYDETGILLPEDICT